jgi:Zn-dependent peptidase ImmA (M78 family)
MDGNMSNDNDDFHVKALSNDEIEKIALNVRLATGTGNQVKADIFHIIRQLSLPGRPLAGLRLEIVPDVQMGRDYALAFVDDRLLKIRSSVHSGAELGNPRDVMTLAHEIGHFILGHGGLPKHRVAAGNRKEHYIQPMNSAEHQAGFFGAALLMLRSHVREMKCADDVANEMGVSLEAATIRFQQVAPKVTPQDILEKIQGLRQSTGKSGYNRNIKTVLSIEQRAKLAWELAWELADKSPNDHSSEYRSVDAHYTIRWSRFQKSQPGGWRLDGDKIVPWESEV